MAGATPDFYNRRKGFTFGGGDKAPAGPGGVKIEHRIGVQAPASVVWALIHDVNGWPRWNPIYPKAEGSVHIGDRLTLTRALPGQPQEVLRPVVLDWTPDDLLHLRITAMAGLVRVTQYMEIEVLGEASCIFSNGELYGGLMGPTVARRLRGSLRRGFAAVSEALKVHAEAQWRSEARATTSVP